MLDRKTERAARFVRTKSRRRQPDVVRKAGPMRDRKAYDRGADDYDLREAVEEWAEDCGRVFDDPNTQHECVTEKNSE